jgi:hypothetical protein
MPTGWAPGRAATIRAPDPRQGPRREPAHRRRGRVVLPLAGQARECGKTVAVGGLEREVHVLERQRQRELSRELPLEIRCNLAACHGETPSAANATSVLFTSFSRDPAPTAPTQMVR